MARKNAWQPKAATPLQYQEVRTYVVETPLLSGLQQELARSAVSFVRVAVVHFVNQPSALQAEFEAFGFGSTALRAVGAPEWDDTVDYVHAPEELGASEPVVLAYNRTYVVVSTHRNRHKPAYWYIVPRRR